MTTLAPPPPRPVERATTLRLARELAGMTVADFGHRLNVNPSHVSRIERRRELPWPKFRRDAARVLGVPEERLFSD